MQRATWRSLLCAAITGVIAGCAQPTRPGPEASTSDRIETRATRLPSSLPVSPADRSFLQRQAAEAHARAPQPMRVTHVEGVLPTRPEYQAAEAARRDWTRLLALALAWRVDGDARWRESLARYFEAWLAIYEISGNPIDETRLGDWLLAERLAGDALPDALRRRTQSFACQLADRYLQLPPARRATSTNNWQSHRVKLAVMAAHNCGDDDRVRRARALFARQLQDNLTPDGPTVDFEERDALHYVVYSLEPLVEAALFDAAHAPGLYATSTRDGRSLARSLRWLAPYAEGTLTHQEFVRSRVRFDAERAAAGVPGFSGLFEPKAARQLYWMAARLDEQWQPLAQQLGGPSALVRLAWGAVEADGRVGHP